jgi:hypothetical protein
MSMNEGPFYTLKALWQDNLLTDEQMIILTNIASEFARLNAAQALLKNQTERLLHAAKMVIEILEPNEA